MALQDLAYQNNQVTTRVEILDIDISTYVTRTDIGTIRSALDTSFLTEYQAGDVTLTVSDPAGNFSTAKDENFFTENGAENSGYLAKVVIYAGYRNPKTGESAETILFRGVLINISRDSKTNRVTLNCADQSDINREPIEGMGIRQNVQLPETTRRSIRGVYPFDARLSPPSRNSVLGTLKGTDARGNTTSQAMTQKNVLDEFGALSEENFHVTQGRAPSLETEVAVTELTDSSISADFRAPLRYNHVTNNVRELADYYNVRFSELTAVEPTLDERFFAAIGRLQVHATQNTPDAPYSWNGTVTDFLVEPKTGFIYALLSDRVSTVMPRLVRYDLQSDRLHVLHQPTSHFEFWKLATDDFVTFYILKTTGTREAGLPVLASYNPSETNSASPPQTSVTRYTTSDGTATDILNTGTSTRPQMATYYFYGNPNERLGFVPDTRQNFTFARNVLWYRYASRTGFGLARYKPSDGTVTREISILRDGRNNEASFDFVIDETGNRILGAHTAQTASRSRILVYRKALAASY